jgi:lysine/ornithine N-monooxygenase
MAAYFFNVSEGERQNILDQHKKPYDGLRTMGWESKNPQTLYVQDFANDKAGVTINSKGDVKTYTNTKIHEQVDIGLLTQDDMEIDENMDERQMCSECGSGYMEEGVCNECGYQMENMEEMTAQEEDLDDVQDLKPSAEFDYVGGADNATDSFHEQDMESDIDEEIKESVENERTTIMEMFQRMKVIK